MTSINYNEFQAGQGVSAPALNENFTLTNNAIENLEVVVNSAITSLTSATQLKANKNGSSAEQFSVADATENAQAVNLGQMNNLIAPLTPVGTVIWYAGSDIPTGYLLCDGSDVSRTTYSDLFVVLGVRYGAGDASTTFTLPDLIGKFIEGGSSSGTYKEAGLPNITGTFCAGIQTGDNSGGFYDIGASNTFQGGVGFNFRKTGFDASYSNSVYGNSDTVQPEAIVLLPCIKY